MFSVSHEFERLDTGDADKTRKTLIAASLSLIALNQVEFVSDTFELFGFSVAIPQDRVVRSLSYAVAALTLIYIFQVAPFAAKVAHRAIAWRDGKWEKAGREELQKIEAQLEHLDEPDHHDFDTWFYLERNARRSRRRQLLDYRITLDVLAATVVKCFIPVALAIVAMVSVVDWQA